VRGGNSQTVGLTGTGCCIERAEPSGSWFKRDRLSYQHSPGATLDKTQTNADRWWAQGRAALICTLSDGREAARNFQTTIQLAFPIRRIQRCLKSMKISRSQLRL